MTNQIAIFLVDPSDWWSNIFYQSDCNILIWAFSFVEEYAWRRSDYNIFGFWPIRLRYCWLDICDCNIFGKTFVTNQIAIFLVEGAFWLVEGAPPVPFRLQSVTTRLKEWILCFTMWQWVDLAFHSDDKGYFGSFVSFWWNKLASLGATLVRNYDSLTHWLTHWQG